MNELEKEAEEYTNKQKTDSFDSQMRRETFTRSSLQESFEAGATSKYVEREKIKAIIDTLDVLLHLNEDDFDRGKGCVIIRNKIEELQKQLE